MKKSGILLLLVLIVGLLAGCGGGVKTYVEPGQGIEVGAGDEFIIALGSNPSTLYTWETDYDQDMLQLMECGYQRIEDDNQVESGASSVETYRFKALNEGNTEITMTYTQMLLAGESCPGCGGDFHPWEGEGIPWAFKVQVKS